MKTSTTTTMKTIRVRVGKPSYIDYDKYIGPRYSDRIYEERDVMAFFSNLLPDEGVRRRIAEIVGVTPEDTFGLLREIGGDCAGAIAFWPPGKRPCRTDKPVYRELTDAEADDVEHDQHRDASHDGRVGLREDAQGE